VELPPHADLKRYCPGDKDDFDRLYAATYQRIFRTLAVMLGDLAAAEDCTQDAFVQAFKAWPRWRPDAPAEAWVHRIAINAASTYRRKQRLRQAGELVHRLGLPEHADPDDRILDRSVMVEVRRLPSKQAAVLVLRHLHGYSNREIGLTLGVSESTVASRLAAAKQTLRARLQPSTRQPENPSPPTISDTSESLRVALDE
jgi:RNA polymerase sigma factor (sigma-70 family)